MKHVSRWWVSTALVLGLGLGGLGLAQAQDSLARVLVDVADVVMRGGAPYYRYGNYGYQDRLVVQYDHHGRPVYYRNVYSDDGHHDMDHGTGYSGSNGYYADPQYGNAYGYRRDANYSSYYRYANPTNYNRGYSNRRHRQHDRHHEHDCLDHGQCGH